MNKHHPDRVTTLNSIMSSGYIMDPELPPISSAVAGDLIKTALKYAIAGTERNIIKLHGYCFQITALHRNKGEASTPINNDICIVK